MSSGCNMMLENDPAPSTGDPTGALFGSGSRSPDGTSSKPETAASPSPSPSPDGRSDLDGADCPWGADQAREAKTIQQAGFKIEYNCDLVLYNEDLYGSITPSWPTFNQVKRNFLAVQAALAADADFLKEASANMHLSHVTFNIKANATELDFAGKTMLFSAYGTVDPARAVSYLKTIFEFDDVHLDGLPVISALGGVRITGSQAQLEYTLSTLTTFTQTYATYREQFLVGRDAIREVKVDERPEDDVPLFRNGTLEMAQTTQKPWAVQDALALAKTYLLLPMEFRNGVTIDFNLPESLHPDQTRPEQTTAKAVESLSRALPTIEQRAPALQHLTIDICGNSINIPGDCGTIDSNKTTMNLGMIVDEGVNGASVMPDAQLDAELNRLLGGRAH